MRKFGGLFLVFPEWKQARQKAKKRKASPPLVQRAEVIIRCQWYTICVPHALASRTAYDIPNLPLRCTETAENGLAKRPDP